MSTSSPSLYLIDGIGPFFYEDDSPSIDWSRIPWDRIAAMDEEEMGFYFDRVRTELRSFSRSVARIGYTGVILDDVFHVTEHEFYEDQVSGKISNFRREFEQLFKIVWEEGLQVFLTMEIMSTTPASEKKLGRSEKKKNEFLADLLSSCFNRYPGISGVIISNSQNDARNSGDDFTRQTVLKNPLAINSCLKALLPVFEKYDRHCVFRPWTDGNVICSETDLEQCVEGIESSALTLSLRYSESGFLRYESLNPIFFSTEVPTLIELQARRQYEGCGEYPAFIGYQYEKLCAELKEVPNVRGIVVSCQSGGVSPFRRLAFVDETAIWTEINAFVTLRIFKYGELVEEAVSRLPNVANHVALLELLRLSEEVISELLYVPDFARRRVYFRNQRIGPQLGGYERHILVSDSIGKLLCDFVEDPEEFVRSGETALFRLRRMRMLALECYLPEADIEFMEKTLELLALGRGCYFRPDDRVLQGDLKDSVKRYRKKYPRDGRRRRYSVRVDLGTKPLKRLGFFTLLGLRKKKKRKFRLIEEIIRLQVLSKFGFLIRRAKLKKK